MTSPRSFRSCPTGFLHVGSAQVGALQLFLCPQHRQHVVLRVEDTNAEKTTQEFVDAITEPLAWLGLDWDEGPYFQSERLELHMAAVQQLLDTGHAYYCDLSQEDQGQERRSGPQGRLWLVADHDVEDGHGVVVRFEPDDGVTVIDDIVRGRSRSPTRRLRILPIRRGDNGGLPHRQRCRRP